MERTIDTCPVFSDKPTVGDWTLISLRNANSEYIEKTIGSSAATKWSTNKRKCYTTPRIFRSTEKTSVKFLPKGTKLSIYEIESMWDFENGTRTFYEGVIEISGVEEKFDARASLYNYKDVREYMDKNYISCK